MSVFARVALVLGSVVLVSLVSAVQAARWDAALGRALDLVSDRSEGLPSISGAVHPCCWGAIVARSEESPQP